MKKLFKFLKISLLWAIGGFVGIIGLSLLLPDPTPEEVAAKQAAAEAQEGKKIQEKLNRMVTDQTLYLSPKDAKLMPMLRQGAEMLLTSGKCDTIETASLSSQSKPKDPTFYYHCGSVGDKNYGTFKLKVSEIKSKSLAIAPPPSETSSYEACEGFIRQQLNFPSTYDSNLFKRASRTFADGRRDVTIEFTAKNAFGLELPGSARCLFIPKKGGGYEMEGHIREEPKS